MDLALVLVLLLVLGAEFVNGWTDSPNAIATVVGTRSLPPLAAVIMAAVLNLVGVLSGTKVASTIGKGIVDASAIDLTTVAAAMLGIIIWSSIAAVWGIPTSETHALVAGLAGAGYATAGSGVLIASGWWKVLIGLFLSTILGVGAALRDDRHLLDLQARHSGEDERAIQDPADLLLCVHGVQPRFQRRPEVHGGIHARSRSRWRPPELSDPTLGDPAVCSDHGGGNAHRRLANHSDHGDEDQ